MTLIPVRVKLTVLDDFEAVGLRIILEVLHLEWRVLLLTSCVVVAILVPFRIVVNYS